MTYEDQPTSSSDPPAGRVTYIASAIRAGEALDPIDATFAARLLDHLAATRRQLDVAALNRARRAMRDDAIRAAAALLPTDLNLAQRAAALLAEARAYYKGRYPKDANQLQPPPEYVGRIRGYLWLAFQAHHKFLWSDRAIEEVISNRSSGN